MVRMWMENDDNPFNFDEDPSDLRRRLEKEKAEFSQEGQLWTLASARGACLKFSKRATKQNKRAREKTRKNIKRKAFKVFFLFIYF